MEKFTNIAKNPIFILSASLLALVGLYLLAVLVHSLTKSKPQAETIKSFEFIDNPEYDAEKQKILNKEPKIKEVLDKDNNFLENLKNMRAYIDAGTAVESERYYQIPLNVTPIKQNILTLKLLKNFYHDQIIDDTLIGRLNEIFIARNRLEGTVTQDSWKTSILEKIDLVITRVQNVQSKLDAITVPPYTFKSIEKPLSDAHQRKTPYNSFTFENEKGHLFGLIKAD